MQEVAIDPSTDSWQTVVSPLASFETEYDLHVKNAENQNVPSLVFAKVSNQINGKTFQLIACSTIPNAERFVGQARFPSNYAYV